jgi:hypothetical protein
LLKLSSANAVCSWGPRDPILKNPRFASNFSLIFLYFAQTFLRSCCFLEFVGIVKMGSWGKLGACLSFWTNLKSLRSRAM